VGPAIHEAAIAFEQGFYELGAPSLASRLSITLSRADPVSIRSMLI